jgi:alginate O-acetyltransferase complex protein AlgI
MRIYFTWLLLPVVLATLPVYWLALRRDGQRRTFLMVVSLVVLAALQPVFAVVAVGLAFVAHQIVEAHKARRLSTRRAVVIAVTVAVVTLAIGKYGQVMVGLLWGHDWLWTHLLMPLGISYFVFRLLQYVFDHVRGVLHDNSLRDLLAFMLFLPTFPAGPLETYQGFYGKRSLVFDFELLSFGLRRIVIGYFKKLFIEDLVFAVYLGKYVTQVLRPGFGFETAHPLQASAFVVIIFVRAYIDLSAYTDLAIGFAALFGFRIMENFHYPFLSRNLADFWRRWHISLSSWCRNNVYFPVFGATRKVWLGLYASMLTMGLWHYVGLNWTMWALWHATGLVTVNWWLKYKKRRRKETKRRPGPLQQSLRAPLGYVMTFCFVALGYAFVGTPNISKAFVVLFSALAGPFVWLAELGPAGLAALLIALALAAGVIVAVTVLRRRPQTA